MLVYEIYMFLLITVLIIVLLFYNLIAYLFFPIIWVYNYLKVQYHKIFSLNKLKKQVLENNGNKLEENNDNKLEENNTVRIKNKLKKISLEIEFSKQK
jgi:hypothetical protein